MAEASLKEAFAAVAKAQNGSDGAFTDAATDAMSALKKSFRLVSKENPDLLDTALSEDEKVQGLQFFMRVYDKRRTQRNQIKDLLKQLLPISSWQFAAVKDEATKASLLEAIEEYKDEDLSALGKALLDGPTAPVVETAAAATAAAAAIVVEEPDDGDSPDELTRKLILGGVAGFRECGFEYPKGRGTEEASDKALSAFTDKFYLGVSRLNTSWSTAKTSDAKDTAAYEGMVKVIPDDDIPKILNFLVTFYEARSVYRGQVKYCVNKLAEVSPRFKAVVEARSGREDRLPWLPALPPETPKAEMAADFPPDAPAGGYTSEEPPEAPSAMPPLKSMVPAGAKCTVVWIDGKTDAYEKATIMKDAGIHVQGFHDNYHGQESIKKGTGAKASEKASQDALNYTINAIVDPDEHVIAVVVNNGPTHKQVLRDVSDFSIASGRRPPWFLACSARGTHEDFKDCGVTVIHKDRDFIQRAAVEELQIRKAGGHSYSAGQEVAYFCANYDGAWRRSKVQEVAPDGKLRLDNGTEILAQDYGAKVRPMTEGSAIRDLIAA